MKLLTGLVFCSLVLSVSSRSFFSFLGEAFDGARDMWRAYSDMREANYIGSDKYFHARGNYDAAKRGPGGAWAAEVIRLKCHGMIMAHCNLDLPGLKRSSHFSLLNNWDCRCAP
ncbi:serum amyloid A2 [Homo sapiens]|uniref:Serum amyloid A protein n=1 Tax=Homo sapiens TaxID=9606 RepID=G3V1D9_HUMAN|nr:serum amyloid A2, isoform CRA_a [Homo sapiens]KAI2558994.1 serum amyloid A2 [Homo sapiens]KAI4070339.1 serum amyloid A2 [Homo sapiens]